jgi:hypothetical protein
VTTVALQLCNNNFGGYAELVYDDVTLVVAGVHVVNPPGGLLTNTHLLLSSPHQKIDQQFPGGTDQTFTLGPQRKITWGTNWKGETAPFMSWLLEFAISIDGS